MMHVQVILHTTSAMGTVRTSLHTNTKGIEVEIVNHRYMLEGRQISIPTKVPLNTFVFPRDKIAKMASQVDIFPRSWFVFNSMPRAFCNHVSADTCSSKVPSNMCLISALSSSPTRFC
jgi:hypothetical protein